MANTRVWHPVIEGLYRFELRVTTDGNGVDAGNCITKALERAIELHREYPKQPDVAEMWERSAVRDAVRAAHAAHQLGLLPTADSD